MPHRPAPLKEIFFFVIFVTGAIDGKTTGIALTQKAFEIGLGGLGFTFVAICLLFFAFSTIIGQLGTQGF